MDGSKRSIGFGNLFEDIFGLNIRGLVTIRDVVIRPGQVAEAAKSEDWLDRYTPTIRLAFFLLTLTSVFRFLWAPEDSQLSAEMNAAFLDRFPESTSAETGANRYFATYSTCFPFFAVALAALSSTFVRVWGEGIGLALRVRLHMMTLVPSYTFTVLSIGIFVFYDEELFMLLTTVSLTLAVVIDFAMAFRVVAATSLLARLSKATLFAFVSMSTGLAAAALSAMIAVVAIAWGY